MPDENKRINPETGQPYPSNKEKLDEITSKIEQGIKDVFESENYKNYLSVMSRFHNYSTNNCMLIYMQNPNATKVASFKAWSEKFDRHVSKGEKGIKIIAPSPYKKKIDVQKIDPDTKEPVTDKDGNPIMYQKEITMPAFKAVTVFDISQTKGKPLPQLAQTLQGKVENFEYMKEAIRRIAPVPIKFEELRDNLDGFFSFKEQSITIREGMSEPQTLCAMVHETAHSLLHNPETTDEKKSRESEEIEAESVAYAVCKYFGIDTDENSFGYLAAWSKDKEVKELRESLDTINETSSVLISSIENRYREILAERNVTSIDSLTDKIADYIINAGNADKDIESPEQLKSMIKGYLEKGDTAPIENILKLTITQQEEYPFDKKANEADKNTVDLLLMEMRDYEKFNFTDVTYKIGDKAYLQIQRMDDGINCDFSFFRQDNYKLMDGGFSDFDENDSHASATMFELAAQIAEDFKMETDDISIVDESIVEAIEKANSIEGVVAENGPRFIEEDKIKPPCPELTQETLDKFGYNDDGMYPITKEVAIDLMQNYCDVYLLYDDGTEAAANDEQEILMHYGCLGVEKETWDRISYRYESQQELNEKEKAFLQSNKDGFAIYQLKSVSSNDEIVFMNSQYLDSKNIPVDSSRYSFRYSDDMMGINYALTESADKTAKEKGKEPDYNFSTEDRLECIYEKFNFQKPEDYHSRSVSVSDILAIRQNGELSFHYVDSVGFTDIPKFIEPQNYLKNAEQSIEDDLGMIDGIINNGKKEKPVPEEKRKPKKKESLYKKLEEAKAKVAEGTNPTKPKERTFDHDA